MGVHSVGEKTFGRHQETRCHHQLPRLTRTCIIVQNVGLMVGQCVLLFASREIGLIILTVSGLLGIPLALHLKLWDSLFITAFFFVINLTGLFVK